MNPNDYAILYVDDEEQALKYFARAFKGRCQVLTASSAAAGWELVQEHAERIAVLVSDQRMPGESGVELLRKVRSEHPRIMRILTTAYADLEDAISAVNTGSIYAYITKPWDLMDLQNMVVRAFDYFLLQRERDLLLTEKLGVYHRLILVDRLRLLATMASGLGAVVDRPLATIRAYWELVTGLGLLHSVVASDDLWNTTQQEARELVQATQALARRFRDFDSSATSDFSWQALTPERCESGGERFQIHGLRRPLLQAVSIFAEAVDAGHIEGRHQDAGAVFTLSGRKPPGAVFKAYRQGGLGEGVEELYAWLVIGHHGGQVGLVADGGGSRLEILLPDEPGALEDDPAGWVAEAIASLE